MYLFEIHKFFSLKNTLNSLLAIEVALMNQWEKGWGRPNPAHLYLTDPPMGTFAS